MTKKTRKTYTADFKAKVALAALAGEKTLGEFLSAAGIRVGAKVSVVNNSGTITLSTPDGGSVVLSDDLAHAVRVEV